MEFSTYAQLAQRTGTKEEDKNDFSILITCLGLAGETGETIDYLKKVYGHKHPLDRQKLTDELGDILWYLSEVARLHDIDLEQVASYNIEKLKKRYPEGFCTERSIKRIEYQTDTTLQGEQA